METLERVDTTGSEARCNFCGNAEKDVHTMVRSGDGTIICDECTINALDIISHASGQAHLRVALRCFEMIASGLKTVSRLVRGG